MGLYTRAIPYVLYTAPTNDSLSEPFYIEATHNSGLYESIRAAQMYEVPTTSLNVETNLDHRHTYHVLDASRSSQHGRNTQLPYHTPQQTPTSEESMEESGEGHDYHELEAPRNVKKVNYVACIMQPSGCFGNGAHSHSKQFSFPYSIVYMMLLTQNCMCPAW